MKNFAVKNNKVYYGEAVVQCTTKYDVYRELVAENDKYFAVGMHGENSGCYPYLDVVFIGDKTTGAFEVIKVFKIIGVGSDGRPFTSGNEGQLRTIGFADESTLLCQSASANAKVDLSLAFYPTEKVGETASPKYDTLKLESYFDYEVVEDGGILLTLKDTVPRTQLLKWNGFDLSYNCFKLWGSFGGGGQAHFMMADSITNESFTVTYGSSTTMTSDYIWERRNHIRDCCRKMFPYHSQIRDDEITKKAA